MLRWATAVAEVDGLDVPPEELRPLGLGLIRVARLRGLSPEQLSLLAAWIQCGEPAVDEYLAAVDLRSVKCDHGFSANSACNSASTVAPRTCRT